MKKWKFVIVLLIILWLAAIITSNYIKENSKPSFQDDNIALIPISGEITSSGDSSLPFSVSGASSEVLVDLIKKANDDSSIKGIILEINSPGGTVLASKEITDAVKESKKPVVAWIRELGASGAYWVASGSDYIIADPMSITGSIGVIGSYLQFEKLMEKYGVIYEQLTTGKYKDTGSPFRELTTEERNLLQGKLNIIHDYFVSDVEANRKLSKEQVEKLANGIFYLGVEAKELGLIDRLRGKKEAEEKIKELTGLKSINLVSYQRKKSFFESLAGLSAYNSYFIGKGIGEGIVTKAKDSRNLIPTV